MITRAWHRPLGSSWPLIKCAAVHWASDAASTMGAALAFYCAFSLVPLLVIIVTLTGSIIGAELAYGHLGEQLRSLFGPATARVLLEAMRSSQDQGSGFAAAISVVSLVIGATSVFAALEGALENIWRARALVRPGVFGWIRTRLLSLGAILAVGFLLLISLTLSTALAALREHFRPRFAEIALIAAPLDLLFTTALVAGLIALIYRYMPARRLPWRPVLGGAIITALLFQVGRWAIGLYLGSSTQPSAFGAAASFAALLLWLYYSAQIFFFGAEITACLGGLRDEELSATSARSR
jgi:membrane protein